MNDKSITQSPMPAKIRAPRRLSPFWLLPAVAFIIGAVLFFQILREQGKIISIRFDNGSGISAGKTTIRYQGLQIGTVKKVNFSENLSDVEVIAQINPEATALLRKGSRFWLVKPSASLAGISGLDALVSGNYITLLPGDGDSEDEFIAEHEQPIIPVKDGDLFIRLIADDLGSMTIGSNVYFRKVPVGSISNYRFTSDQKKVEIDLIIDKKYANLVRKESRFWNISGINFNASLTGISFSMDSLVSIIQGAVSFDSPEDSTQAEQGESYPLYDSLKSAQRGIEIAVTLPSIQNLRVNETPVFLDGIQVGMLSQLESSDTLTNKDKTQLNGKLLIAPNAVDALRSTSQILLKEPSFSLNKEQFSQLDKLFRGSYLEIITGEGEPKRNFIVQKESDYLLSLPNTLVLNFHAPKSYGIDKGQGIYYNDIKIGEILQRDLELEKVLFKGIIFPQYRHLIFADSQFVAMSNLDVTVGIDGIRMQASSPANWLQGGVQVLASKGKGEAKQTYPLYKDLESAKLGITDEKKATLQLSANQVSGVNVGSPVLYHQFPIGEVLSVIPEKQQFAVELFIEPHYRHLITDKSRFWIEPAIQLDISSQGLNIQTLPLMRALKGAISVDNIGIKKDHRLYTNYNQTQPQYHITLITDSVQNIAEKQPLKYKGLTIGEVSTIEFIAAQKQFKLTAAIQKNYYPMLAKQGTQFKLITPEINLNGLQHLEAVMQNYIEVELGQGKTQTQFALTQSATLTSDAKEGLSIIIESSDTYGIVIDAPVLYRGLPVGTVTKLTLSELGDRVLIYVTIDKKYQHLVRTNSQFWQASGYSVDIGLNGANINSGTISQLLKGGIAFSTPSNKIVQPSAKHNQRFLLQRKAPNDAQYWQQGAQ